MRNASHDFFFFFKYEKLSISVVCVWEKMDESFRMFDLWIDRSVQFVCSFVIVMVYTKQTRTRIVKIYVRENIAPFRERQLRKREKNKRDTQKSFGWSMRDVNIVIFMYILLLEFVKKEIDRMSECDKERERKVWRVNEKWFRVEYGVRCEKVFGLVSKIFFFLTIILKTETVSQTNRIMVKDNYLSGNGPTWPLSLR